MPAHTTEFFYNIPQLFPKNFVTDFVITKQRE